MFNISLRLKKMFSSIGCALCRGCCALVEQVDVENFNSISMFDISSIKYRDIDIDIEEYIAIFRKPVMTEIDLLINF